MIERERAINAAYRKLHKLGVVGALICEREGKWYIQERHTSDPLAIRSTLKEAVTIALKRLQGREEGVGE